MSSFAALDRDEAIDSRVAVHDSDHVEVKLDCHLGGAKNSRYRVETYFFVPRSLGLNEQTYSRAQFYHDVQTYLRFKTPVLPMAQLADPSAEGSPLAQIRTLSGELRRSPRIRSLAAALSYELRMFGCILRANLRDQVAAIKVRVRKLPDGERARAILVDDIRTIGGRFLDDLDALLTEWRGLRATLLHEPMPRRTRDTYAMVDEYISQAVELHLTNLLRAIDRGPQPDEVLEGLRGRARAALLAERDYRVGAGYGNDWEDGDGEHFVYRRGMLKKLVTSVLWLEIDKEEEGRSMGDLVAGFAAGVAMLFTVVAALLSRRMWMINSAGFVIAAVVTYMLKDRMKDWIKRAFHRGFNRWLADYKVNIRDPMTGALIGKSRESFRYVKEDQVPPEVLALRRRRSGSPVEIDAKREVILAYDKEIRLESKALRERMHLEDYDLNDISRIALRELLIRADDPNQALAIYDQDDDRVVKRNFHKVYHLNLVMVLGAGRGKDRSESKRHLRVVFDKKAIRRLEEVS